MVAFSSPGQNQRRGKFDEMEWIDKFMEWNSNAAEGPPAHNPAIKTNKGNQPFNFIHQLCWLRSFSKLIGFHWRAYRAAAAAWRPIHKHNSFPLCWIALFHSAINSRSRRSWFVHSLCLVGWLLFLFALFRGAPWPATAHNRASSSPKKATNIPFLCWIPFHYHSISSQRKELRLALVFQYLINSKATPSTHRSINSKDWFDFTCLLISLCFILIKYFTPYCYNIFLLRQFNFMKSNWRNKNKRFIFSFDWGNEDWMELLVAARSIKIKDF